ncbi:MAG: hypothetical protein QOG66_3438 [Methylobacteriaceae bacterium]|jgi:hypothetical protein|nr:hypothetical protein [Methylobacteriaceae bacterium]
MTIYAVHAPRDARNNVATAADRCAFVRDSFSWGAFFFGPLWLLRHQLWFAFLGWLAAILLLWAGSYWLGLSNSAIFWCYVAIAVFLGLEGGMLRSSALRRRGFELADVVASDTRDGAERTFYARWLSGVTAQQSGPLFRPVTPAASTGERVIGTFPDAEA